jgi:hypothetical protein
MYRNVIGESFQVKEECSYKTQYYSVDGNALNLHLMLEKFYNMLTNGLSQVDHIWDSNNK